jgi:hypothetical protein
MGLARRPRLGRSYPQGSSDVLAVPSGSREGGDWMAFLFKLETRMRTNRR